jgi:hypothetical protein
LVEQDHEFLSLSVLSFEATWLEDILQGFSGRELKPLILSYVIPVEARIDIVFCKFVPVLSKQIVLQITFFRGHLSHDYWSCLRQRFTKWTHFLLNRYLLISSSCLFLKWSFIDLSTDVRSIWLWAHNSYHLCQVICLILLV